jgi:DAK2 domain fusion protein YloV
VSESEVPPANLDGDGLRELFEAAYAGLVMAADAINAINVYPVPDGDTGANMSATMREAVAVMREVPAGSPAAAVAAAVARGALYGARGNSGVILSQALRGFADGLDGAAEIDAAFLARGLERAGRAAYQAVSKPQEGTMLTVLREAATAASEVAGALPEGGRGAPGLATLESAVSAAMAAEIRTQEQLPSLREAGVPDAGGEGICVILRGMLARLRGEELVLTDLPTGGHALEFAASRAEEAFGYCTEFALDPVDGAALLDLARVRSLAEAMGRSVVLVGDDQLARVHVHTEQPEELLQAMGALGRIQRVKVDDMGAQRARFEARGSGATAAVGLLALSRGQGFDRIFESLGAHVLDLGTIEKPAAGEVARAADALGIADVIVLPNHKNVLLSAEQASTLTRCTMHLVPSKTLAQGVAAAVAFDPEDRPVELIERMTEAAAAVRTVEVTVAAASRTVEGVRVRAGHAIAVVDGKLVAARPTLEDALTEGLVRAGAREGVLVTLYVGEGGDLERAEAAVRAAFPAAELEVLDSGQPLYPYIASVES